MKVIKNIDDYEGVDGLCIAPGNFDGVHVGHVKILRRLLDCAKERGLHSAVLTFRPHPVKFLHGDIPLIATHRQKIKYLSELSFDYLFDIGFDNRFASIAGADFVEEYLVKRLKAKVLLTGEGFHFGKDREGNPSLLKELGDRFGYEYFEVEKFKIDDEYVSSSLIRKYILNGELKKAKNFLGRDYIIEGTVVAGDGIGRKFLYPTINIAPESDLLPPSGVYAAEVIIFGKRFPAGAYIGSRPTIADGGALRVEAFLFDFDLEVYGEFVELSLIRRVRGEHKFASAKELKNAIGSDLVSIKKFLENYKG